MSGPNAVHDLIIIGCGGVGSAALFYAAQKGLDVIGIDRFDPAHAMGSSHGQTRIIRQGYFEHPSYVPLLLESYQAWAEIEKLSGQTLYHQTGLLEIGPPNGVLIQGVLESKRLHNLAIEEISTQECRQRFPQFHIDDSMVAVFEKESGYLLVEKCVSTLVQLARNLGASYLVDPVTHWEKSGNSFVVNTESNQFRCKHLIVSGGAWANDLLETHLGVELKILQKHLHWFDSESKSYDAPNSPTFFYESEFGYLYGFPRIDSLGMKIANHSGGAIVTDPLQVDRSIDADERAVVEQFAQKYLVDAGNIAHKKHAVCMYTMSPDEHFIIDRIGDLDGVAFAAGLSGHGFKFCPVLGRELVEMALGNEASTNFEFLSKSRFA